MDKIINNKIILRLIIVVLFIVSINLYFEKRQIQNYTNEMIAQEMKWAIGEIKKINETIPKIIEFDKEERQQLEIKHRSIYMFCSRERDILNIINMKEYEFSFWSFIGVTLNVERAIEKENLSEEDRKYLRRILKYNKRIVEASNNIFDKYNSESYGRRREYNKFIQKNMGNILKEFYKRANEISIEENYREIDEYFREQK